VRRWRQLFSQPELVLSLLGKSHEFLAEYAMAFRTGWRGGSSWRSPQPDCSRRRGLAKIFVSVRKADCHRRQNENSPSFSTTAQAKLAHLPKVLESGAEIYHFGAPMDLLAALQQVKGAKLFCAATSIRHTLFTTGTPDTIRTEAMHLLHAAAGNPAFVLSSGCDLPPGTRLENVEVFYQVVQSALPI